MKKILTSALAVAALTTVALPLGAMSASATGYDATGRPIGDSSVVAPAPVMETATIAEGERVGRYMAIDVTVPQSGTSTVRIYDARGHEHVDEEVTGGQGVHTYLVDAPYGKTRLFSAQVFHGNKFLTGKTLVSALGGPKL